MVEAVAENGDRSRFVITARKADGCHRMLDKTPRFIDGACILDTLLDLGAN
jgi:hypothetical protein